MNPSGETKTQQRGTGAWGYLVVGWLFVCFTGCAHVRSGVTPVAGVGGGAAQPATAGGDPPSKLFALVIGNASYSTPLRTLANPVNDARSIADALRALDFDVDEVQNATITQMDAARDRFEAKLRSTGGVGLFYFAGHGLQVDGVNYLVPIGARLDDERAVAREAVSASDVIEAMSSARDGINIVILDACRDNPYEADAPGRTVSRSASRGLALMNAGDGTVIAYATSPGKTAGDGDGTNGTYSGMLLEHLNDEGLTIEEMLKKTSAAVRSKTDGQQVPWMASSLAVDFYLRPAAPAAASELLALARSNQASEDYLGVLHALDRAEQSRQSPLTGPERLEAAELRERATVQLASLRVEVRPSTATVRVNGTTYFSADGQLKLNPGLNHVQVSNAEYRSATRSLRLGPGAHEVLSLSLRPLANGWAWVVGGASAAAISVAVTMGVLAKQRKNTLDDHCADMRCPDTSYNWQADRDQGRRFAHTSDAMVGVGVVSAATAVVLAFAPHLFFRRGVDRSIPQVSCAKGSCVAQAQFAFR